MVASASVGDQWEYEYSISETETFYVDVDLSSINGVIKSKNAGDRKTLKRPDRINKTAEADKSAVGIEVVETDKGQATAFEDDNDDGPDDDHENDENTTNVDAPQMKNVQGPDTSDSGDTDSIQILELDTTNPIIAYNGQIYSCTWHDMLGTTMFVSKHQEAPFHEPEIATDDYDLIGASQIKLVGRRARVVPKPRSKKRNREDSEEAMEHHDDDAEGQEPAAGFQRYVPDGRSLGTITRTNPKTNIDIKHQANFLERLMEIKKARGEHDTVRTFVDRATVTSERRRAQRAVRMRDEKGKGKQKSQDEDTEQRLRREIADLNQRVVRGDNTALEELQAIYADMEEDAQNEDEVLIEDASATAAESIRASTDGDASHLRILVGRGDDQDAPHVPDTGPNGASGGPEP